MIEIWNEHLQQWKTFLEERISNANNIGEEIRFKRQLNVIQQVKNAAVLNTSILIKFIDPSNFENKQNIEIDDYFFELNDSQKKAVQVSLSDNDISFIKGPPGTGKTQVISEVCLQLYKQNPDIRVLLCSETHVAVNNVLLKISDKNEEIRMIRIDDKENNPMLEKMNSQNIKEEYLAELENEINDSKIVEVMKEAIDFSSIKSLEKALALSANIVGMTCNRVGAYNFINSSEMFDVVIIDEVCKATLPEILMPLTIAGKAILVGDPQQLPPVFCSEDIEIINSIENCKLQDYLYIDKLFEISENASVLLDTQYRMSNQIGNMIGQVFYNNKIINGRGEDVNNSIVWINYNPKHDWPMDNENLEIKNIDECDIILSLLRKLDQRFSKEDKKASVAVISPYRHQAIALKEQIEPSNFSAINVKTDTVDGFQGKECDVVIFSITRTIGSFRFLADKRRLNVALSRARDNIYIVGDITYAQNNPLLCEILKYCDTQFFELIDD